MGIPNVKRGDYGAPKNCPHCGMINLPSAECCDCGFSFVTRKHDKSRADPEYVRRTKIRRRVIQALLELVGILAASVCFGGIVELFVPPRFSPTQIGPDPSSRLKTLQTVSGETLAASAISLWLIGQMFWWTRYRRLILIAAACGFAIWYVYQWRLFIEIAR